MTRPAKPSASSTRQKVPRTSETRPPLSPIQQASTNLTSQPTKPVTPSPPRHRKCDRLVLRPPYRPGHGAALRPGSAAMSASLEVRQQAIDEARRLAEQRQPIG